MNQQKKKASHNFLKTFFLRVKSFIPSISFILEEYDIGCDEDEEDGKINLFISF